MEPSTVVLPFLASPFPGLRAFDLEESLLFFGRETHTEALLRRLSESRFLAVVGSSGCGKSSLVRAGLLPALFRGYLVSATSRWRFAILRPGTAPIDALAAALAKDGALGSSQDVATLRETLGSTSGGLVEAVRRAGLAPGESLLVVVDQFEELFRFAREGQSSDREGQASLFVGLLLRAVESDVPIYVTLTMRSDYQGDCAQFPGLPEALNRSQYLVPRLTRDQRREAIVKPLEIVGTDATPRLVNRLLNDAGDDPDQLPVLQHALLQTYRHWQQAGGHGDVDLPDYEAVGGIAHALGKHGDAILAGFAEDDQRLAEKIFRCLTTTEGGRGVRRPRELGAIYEIVSAADEPARTRMRAVISAFAQRASSLLMLSSPELEPDTVVDITHESLMRKWPALEKWVQEEARSADWYRDLARDAFRRRSNDAGLWRDPELSGVLKRRDREGWNEAWARQYCPLGDPPFDEVESFLGDSVQAQAKERRREKAQQRRISILLSLLLGTIVVAVLVVYVLNQRNQSAIEVLTKRYLSTQEAYGAAKQEALRDRARYEEAARQLSLADPEEKAQLRQQLEALRRDYNVSLSKANVYEVQLNGLRKNQDLTSSDHSDLLKRIQDLQGQLNAVTAERDKLRYVQAAPSKGTDPELRKRIEELQAQLTTVTAERDRLQDRLESQRAGPQRAVARPAFVVVPQNSIVRLPAAPFAGNVAIGVGNIHHQPSSPFRVYVWTTEGRTPLPEPFRGDETRFKNSLQKLGLKDDPKEDCRADGPGGLSCYRVQGGDIILGKQPPGSFTLGGARYEIRATGWNGDVKGYPDAVSLTLYPASPAATAN